MDVNSRFYFLITGLIAWFCCSSQMIYLRIMNTKYEKSLIYFLKISNEIKDDSFEYYGLPKKENKEYWQLQNRRIFNINRVFNISAIIFSTILGTLNFSMKFKINLFDYILFGTLHSIHHYFYIDTLFTGFLNLHLFPFAFAVFFRKSFENLNSRLEKIAGKRIKKIDNLKLNKLIKEFNCVIMEFLKANQYWRLFFGSSFFVAIVVITFSTFIFFVASLEFKVVILNFVLTILPIMILFPYYQSTKILHNVSFVLF